MQGQLWDFQEMFGKTDPLEVLALDGEELYNAHQVAGQLGLNSHELLAALSIMKESHYVLVTNDMKVTSKGRGFSSLRKMKSCGEYFLKEPGIYDLLLTSDTREAENFREWLFSEVVPSILCTGSYRTMSYSARAPQPADHADHKKQL